MHRHWYRCDWDHHLMQWTRETPQPENSPCAKCELLQFPWASEDMKTAKFKQDNGIVDLPPPPQLGLALGVNPRAIVIFDTNCAPFEPIASSTTPLAEFADVDVR